MESHHPHRATACSVATREEPPSVSFTPSDSETLHRVGCPEPASASSPSTDAFATARIGPPSATVSCQYYSPLPTNHRACYQLLRLLTSAEEPINIRSHRHDATTGRTLVARYPPITVPAGLKIVHPPSAKSQYQPPLLCLLLPAVSTTSQVPRSLVACVPCSSWGVSASWVGLRTQPHHRA